jgi:ribosomal protein S18 acetylase RimI-like enzyme
MAFEIRSATPADVPTLADLIRQLAIYEKLEEQMVGDPQDLSRHLFGDRPYGEALVAQLLDPPISPEQSGLTPATSTPEISPSDSPRGAINPRILGFTLFFHTYSTFLMKPGLYIEDLFVVPEYRGQGIGKALLRSVAQLAVDRGCGRLEWSVLDWNAPAIAFYEHLGATVLPDWRICRMTEATLRHVSTGA